MEQPIFKLIEKYKTFHEYVTDLEATFKEAWENGNSEVCDLPFGYLTIDNDDGNPKDTEVYDNIKYNDAIFKVWITINLLSENDRFEPMETPNLVQMGSLFRDILQKDQSIRWNENHFEEGIIDFTIEERGSRLYKSLKEVIFDLCKFASISKLNGNSQVRIHRFNVLGLEPEVKKAIFVEDQVWLTLMLDQLSKEEILFFHQFLTSNMPDNGNFLPFQKRNLIEALKTSKLITPLSEMQYVTERTIKTYLDENRWDNKMGYLKVLIDTGVLRYHQNQTYQYEITEIGYLRINFAIKVLSAL